MIVNRLCLLGSCGRETGEWLERARPAEQTGSLMLQHPWHCLFPSPRLATAHRCPHEQKLSLWRLCKRKAGLNLSSKLLVTLTNNWQFSKYLLSLLPAVASAHSSQDGPSRSPFNSYLLLPAQSSLSFSLWLSPRLGPLWLQNVAYIFEFILSQTECWMRILRSFDEIALVKNADLSKTTFFPHKNVFLFK